MTVEEAAQIMDDEKVVKVVTEKKGGKTVLVAVRIDRSDRLLLNWALVKVADPGDRVVVLHVSRGVSEIYSEENHPSLDGYLEVYKGLCSVKQLDLVGQVSRGGSVRKVIVREAKLRDVAVVVVGINRLNAFGGWLSSARFCAKRLSPSTTVLAVQNGKVVFRQGSSHEPPGLLGDWRLSIYPIPSLNLRESHSYLSVSQASEVENPSLKMVKSFDNGSIRNSSSLVSLSSIISSCEVKEDDSSQTQDDKESVSISSIAEVAKELSDSEPKLGWPLLKGSKNSASIENMEETQARKMSVVQWVMSLPNRVPAHHRTKSDSGPNKTGREGVISEKKNMKKSFSVWGKIPKELELLVMANSSSCKWFSHSELMDATNQFSQESLIGSGGCSRVYKGYLTDGKTVAVKILKVSKEAWKDFALEVDISSSLKHKHITALLGVCLDENELILVYNFLSNGSLEENLHAKEKSGLSWQVRFNVAVGVAEAINYLHKECPQPIIHRDIKSSNILLSDKFEPQLSDFGLAIWEPSSSQETQTDVVGTFGYLAPEYFMYGKISNKIDVYSFGVVLLELLSGRKPISNDTPKGQESLVMWAKPILENGDIVSIMDPNLAGNFNELQMRRMVLAVTLCITRKPRLRPEMNQILELLRGEKCVEDWMNAQANEPKDSEDQDGDEVYPDSSASSHLGVAMLDVDDANTSFSSVEQSSHHTFEDYLKGRWSRSSSFD